MTHPPAEKSRYGVVSPYLIPKSVDKVVNVGDGFILRAVERLLGRFPADLTFSSRCLPTPEELAVLESCGIVVLAGANQLTDDYSIWPGFDAERLGKSQLRLAPMAVGLHGEAGRNVGMTVETRNLIRLIHDRVPYSSWRCPRTTAYLNQSVPELRDRFLMTGCVVLYDEPLLSGSRFHHGQDVVAVTTTERGDFWERETATIEFVARRFPASRRLLVIHQDFVGQQRRSGSLKRKAEALLGLDRASALRKFARARGFEVVVPRNADEALALYETVDLHVGSRLHAHLRMLSQNRRSFLTKVDERITGFAEHFDFPVCDPLRLEHYLDADFERVRDRARRTHDVMRTFVDSLGRPS